MKRESVFIDEVYAALSWQGGTIHQAVAEIKRLKELESKRVPVGICRHDHQTHPIAVCDDGTAWALNLGHWRQIAPIPGTRADK